MQSPMEGEVPLEHLWQMMQQDQVDRLLLDVPDLIEPFDLETEPVQNKFNANYNRNNSPSLSSIIASLSDKNHDAQGSTEHRATEEYSPTSSNNNNSNKRKRREKKTACEAKRRVKLNDSLASLRTMLFGDARRMKDFSKITKEALLTSAVEEIAKLREQLSHKNQVTSRSSIFQSLGTGIYPKQFDYNLSLSDPHNRAPYSMEDLERAFQIMFAREVERCCSVGPSRPHQAVFHSIKSLEDVGKKIGKAEYLLSAGILEQTFHSTLTCNTKALRTVLQQNWKTYQSIKKEDPDHLHLYTESEMGAWILADMALLEFMTGNFEASERIYKNAKELTKRINHLGTNHYMLANVAWNMRGSVSVETAHKINSILQHNYMWSSVGLLLISLSLIANGKHKEGINSLEASVSQMMGNGIDSVDVCMAATIIDAYITTGNLDKGLGCANYMIQKLEEYNIEGITGKAEVLRLKAKLLMMKKFPDYVADVLPPHFVDASVKDLITICEPVEEEVVPVSYGPCMNSVIQTYMKHYSNSENEDIEMILRAAMNLAHTKGLYTIELRCAVDLTRYFMHLGNNDYAMETVKYVEDCVARMKGAQDSCELQKALYVISFF